MRYDEFDFDVGWATGVDWAPYDPFLALSANTLLDPNLGESPSGCDECGW